MVIVGYFWGKKAPRLLPTLITQPLLNCNTLTDQSKKWLMGHFFHSVFVPEHKFSCRIQKQQQIQSFEQPPSLHLHKSIVILKIQYLFSSLHSACKFVFRDKKWVEKMSHKSYFGLVSQNVTNQKRLHDKSW